MHLTNAADLMALYERLFLGLETDTLENRTEASNFSQPAPELAAPPVPLGVMMGSADSVLSASLMAFAARHAPERQAEFVQLAEQIAAGALGQPATAGDDPRLLEYVYPVV